VKALLLMWTATDAAGGTQADIDAWADFDREARAAGVAVTNGALAPPAESVLVRPDLAEPQPGDETIGGTFTHGPEQIQAFYLLDCKDLDDARAWARRLPTRGTVEVRALLEYDLG
jgi:hypothetical protein